MVHAVVRDRNHQIMWKYAGTLAVVIIAVVLVAGPGLPVQPTYATSKSMEPAIEQGDVYFVVETEDVEPGDIAMFYSGRTGAYSTHRIVERTDDGFITKGDNNPSTDQQAGYPPVEQSAIVGKVVETGGQPVTISGIRPIISVLQANPYAVIVLAGIFLLGPEVWAARSRVARGERDVVFAKDLIHPLFVYGAIIAFLLLLWGASTHTLTWVAIGESTGSPHTVVVGEPTETTVFVETFTPPLTTVIVEADGMSVVDKSVRGSIIELDVVVPPIESRGAYWTDVHVYPYPATLPLPILLWLHKLHWFLAVAGSMVPVFGAAGVLYGATVDGRTRLRLPRSRWLRRVGGED